MNNTTNTLTDLQGITGSQGVQGVQGSIGIQGLRGAQGAQGFTGANGIQGVQGVQGSVGFQGLRGCDGLQGVPGHNGAMGAQGITGRSGAQGLRGAQGLTGIQGVQGVQGTTGSPGYMGYVGANGEVGIQGLQGAKGHIWVDGVSLDGYNTHLFHLVNNKLTSVDNTKLTLNNGAKISVWLNQDVYNYILNNNNSITVDNNVFMTVDNVDTLEVNEVTSNVYYSDNIFLTDIINIEKDLNTIINLTYYNNTWYYSGGLIGSTNDGIEYVAGKDIDIDVTTNTIDIALDKNITTNIKVGFLEANQTLTAGMSLSQILERIMIKEIGAKITKPQVTISTTVNNNREVGTALGTVTFDVNYTDGYYSSADTSIYTATQFNQQNNTTNGKLLAGCAEGDYTLYYNINNIVGNIVGQNINSYTDNEIKMEPVVYKFSLKQEYDESMVNTVKTNIGNNTDVNIPSGTANSNELGIKFYYTTNVIHLDNVVWNTRNNQLELNEVVYTPSVELANAMLIENGGEFLTSNTQNINNEYIIAPRSSLAIIIPKDMTFSTYSTADTTQTNIFANFRKYAVFNNINVEYDVYILSNNSVSGTTEITGLTYIN